MTLQQAYQEYLRIHSGKALLSLSDFQQIYDLRNAEILDLTTDLNHALDTAHEAVALARKAGDALEAAMKRNLGLLEVCHQLVSVFSQLRTEKA